MGWLSDMLANATAKPNKLDRIAKEQQPLPQPDSAISVPADPDTMGRELTLEELIAARNHLDAGLRHNYSKIENGPPVSPEDKQRLNRLLDMRLELDERIQLLERNQQHELEEWEQFSDSQHPDEGEKIFEDKQDSSEDQSHGNDRGAIEQTWQAEREQLLRAKADPFGTPIEQEAERPSDESWEHIRSQQLRAGHDRGR